jgi:hypothetical protein
MRRAGLLRLFTVRAVIPGSANSGKSASVQGEVREGGGATNKRGMGTTEVARELTTKRSEVQGKAAK